MVTRRCNGTRDSIRALVAQLNAAPPMDNMEVVVAPPFLYLDQVLGSLHPRYGVCAQNAWVGGPGAFTGEISAEQLADLGLAWVILGHSERRALCGESNETVGKKCAHALAVGLSVILCVGETLAQREAHVTLNVITDQLAAVKAHVKDWSQVVIAYGARSSTRSAFLLLITQRRRAYLGHRHRARGHAGPGAGGAQRHPSVALCPGEP